MPSTLKDFVDLCSLGKGAFGDVFRAKRIVDGRTYVLKVVSMSKLSSKEQLAAIGEAKILAAINSPYVVRYYDSFIDDGKLILVIEYCDQGDLQLFIQNEGTSGKIDEEKIWSIVVNLLLSMESLHSLRILHRDIKPANIFLSSTQGPHPNVFPYSVKLGDFGVSRVLSESSQFAQSLVGTPYYLSPELINGSPYDNKSDMWALGCVFYELCCLQRPFLAQNQAALFMKILSSKPQQIPSSYSPLLRKVVGSLLEKVAAKRPSAAQLLSLPGIVLKLTQRGYDLPESVIRIVSSRGQRLPQSVSITNSQAGPLSSGVSSDTAENNVTESKGKSEPLPNLLGGVSSVVNETGTPISPSKLKIPSARRPSKAAAPSISVAVASEISSQVPLSSDIPSIPTNPRRESYVRPTSSTGLKQPRSVTTSTSSLAQRALRSQVSQVESDVKSSQNQRARRRERLPLPPGAAAAESRIRRERARAQQLSAPVSLVQRDQEKRLKVGSTPSAALSAVDSRNFIQRVGSAPEATPSRKEEKEKSDPSIIKDDKSSPDSDWNLLHSRARDKLAVESLPDIPTSSATPRRVSVTHLRGLSSLKPSSVVSEEKNEEEVDVSQLRDESRNIDVDVLVAEEMAAFPSIESISLLKKASLAAVKEGSEAVEASVSADIMTTIRHVLDEEIVPEDIPQFVDSDAENTVDIASNDNSKKEGIVENLAVLENERQLSSNFHSLAVESKEEDAQCGDLVYYEDDNGNITIENAPYSSTYKSFFGANGMNTDRFPSSPLNSAADNLYSGPMSPGFDPRNNNNKGREYPSPPSEKNYTHSSGTPLWGTDESHFRNNNTSPSTLSISQELELPNTSSLEDTSSGLLNSLKYGSNLLDELQGEDAVENSFEFMEDDRFYDQYNHIDPQIESTAHDGRSLYQHKVNLYGDEEIGEADYQLGILQERVDVLSEAFVDHICQFDLNNDVVRRDRDSFVEVSKNEAFSMAQVVDLFHPEFAEEIASRRFFHPESYLMFCKLQYNQALEEDLHMKLQKLIQ